MLYRIFINEIRASQFYTFVRNFYCFIFTNCSFISFTSSMWAFMCVIKYSDKPVGMLEMCEIFIGNIFAF